MMIPRWIALIGLAIASIGLTLGLRLGGAASGLSQIPWPFGQSSRAEVAAPPAIAPLAVEPARLQATVLDYAVPRHKQGDRQDVQQRLTQSLQALGWQVTPQPFTTGVNLVATRPLDLHHQQNPPSGSPSAPAIVIGAHYDTVPDSPGADDNGSAIAAMLELARLLIDQPTQRPVTLVLFDQEEVGLLGSQAYADHPAINSATVAAVLILDMVGYACHTVGCQRYPDQLPTVLRRGDRGDFLAAIGGWDHADLLQAVTQGAAIPLETLRLPLGTVPPDLLRSDHAPFWREGIPAVLLTDTANFRNPHYHQPTDTPDTLDWEFLTGVTQTVVQTVVTLANPDGDGI